jgi:NAD+---dinitrogen-reductase ADP-D-ribosyltransferase
MAEEQMAEERMANEPDSPRLWRLPLGSLAFNAEPRPLHIADTVDLHPLLFGRLAACTSAGEARDMFARYMQLSFGPPASPTAAAGALPLRGKSSYLRLLQGWGLDANGAAGAMLKRWAESRFGLAPAFHGVALSAYPGAERSRFLEQHAGGHIRNHSLWQQLDLLFEFCQWMLARFALMGPGPRVTLWRGSNRVEEQLVSGSLRQRHCVLRLNNLVSFSRSREQAECFGDWVLQAEVPLVKLLLVPGLIDTRSLDGESEVLALGGDYAVVVGYAH